MTIGEHTHGLLSDEEKAIYEWQSWVPGFGYNGQQKLKDTSVLVTRCGGLGGVAAYELAAAGTGKLVIAHGGNVKPSDLNRQLLMTYEWLGRPRVESAARRLKQLNPRLIVETIPENACDDNADALVSRADIVIDAAPLFSERYALNEACVKQDKPMVECAMYEMEAHLTTIVPGRTACLRCIYPEDSATWKRQFPVFGAVSGAVGCMAAAEVIKLAGGIGEPLLGRMLTMNLRDMTFRSFKTHRDRQCATCREGGR